jgi:hypothetical protein
MKNKFNNITNEDKEYLSKLVEKWIKWSLEKQDEVFQSTELNKKLFEYAKSHATY